jgi:hypothetical protein
MARQNARENVHMEMWHDQQKPPEQRTSNELVELIRWMGMEEEAESAQQELSVRQVAACRRATRTNGSQSQPALTYTTYHSVTAAYPGGSRCGRWSWVCWV